LMANKTESFGHESKGLQLAKHTALQYA